MSNFQKVPCDLTKIDSNAFSILGTVRKALVKAGHPEKAKEFMERATKGNYDQLLATAMDYIDPFGRETDEDEDDDGYYSEDDSEE